MGPMGRWRSIGETNSSRLFILLLLSWFPSFAAKNLLWLFRLLCSVETNILLCQWRERGSHGALRFREERLKEWTSMRRMKKAYAFNRTAKIIPTSEPLRWSVQVNNNTILIYVGRINWKINRLVSFTRQYNTPSVFKRLTLVSFF